MPSPHWEERSHQYGQLRYGVRDDFHDRQATAGEIALTEAALTLVPLGGVVRGAKALRWGYHGLRGSRFYRRGKKGFRFRDKKTGRWRRRPPTVRRDLYQAQAHARHGYRRGREAVDRRLPLRGPRHLVDKWAGRAELVTRPSAYLERRALGRLVPGGVYTVGGVKYVATRLSSSPSKGRGGPSRTTPTHRRGRRPPRPKSPGGKGWTRPHISHSHRTAPGSKKSLYPGGKRAPCPPGHYYSFRHRRCVRSKFR